MGKLGRLRRLGDLNKRIREAKKSMKTLGHPVEWFKRLPVKMSKDSLVAVVQKEIAKNKKFKSASSETQARYLTIAYETIMEYPEEKVDPVASVELAKTIERRLGEYDAEIENQN